MIGKLRDLFKTPGNEWVISIVTRDDPRKLFDAIGSALVSFDIKRYSPHRSKDANALCWAMCSDIGRAITPPVDKIEIYRRAIRAVGVYVETVVKLWDVETIRERWASHGDGWFVDVMDDAGPGRKTIHLYFGSSTYTVSEMRTLLDWLVDQGEQMGIVVKMSKRDEERALERWGKALSKRKESVISADE